jgi:methylthioribulose-1-phosphate dehydratase
MITSGKRRNSGSRARGERNGSGSSFLKHAAGLCEIGRSFYARGWANGTGGNYSAVVDHDPLQLAITPSGMEKGAMTPPDILQINSAGEVERGRSRPSFEYLIHLAIVRARGAGAVLHTHSVWSTILSEIHATRGGLAISGFEMLKGLEGVKTHQHREWIPILENSQDMPELGCKSEDILNQHPAAHGFLLQGHGLYTWGKTLTEAKRHIEIFEFLFEVLGRAPAAGLRIEFQPCCQGVIEDGCTDNSG